MSGALVAGAGGAVGSLIQGRGTADTLTYQANLQRNNATMAIQAAKFDADRQSMFAQKKLGSISEGYAASGVDINTSGSVLSVIGASAANAELDRQSILHGGTIKAINFENQASMDDRASQNALTGSYFNAVGSLFLGGAKLWSQGSGGKSTSDAAPGAGEEAGEEAGAEDSVAEAAEAF